MKRTVVFMTGLALTGSAVFAGAQEQSTEQEWDTDSGIVTQDEREDRTGMETDTQSQYETQSQTQQTDPYDTQSDPYSTESDPYGSSTESDPYSSQSETETQAGMQGSHDLSQMSSSELEGKSIVSSTGEEIGTIEKVGYSDQQQDKVAAVNVGGFLGVGEKVVAIPLSDLSLGTDDSITTTMDRETLEQQQEIDPSMRTEESSTDPTEQY